jgi:hypothetical protein
LDVRLRDDYGCVGAWLDYQVQTEEGGRQEEKRQSIPYEPDGERAADAQPQDVTLRHRLELPELNLKPGMMLAFHVGARDANNLTGPGVGRSGELALRIVTEEELRADFLRREQDLRLQFGALFKEQQALVDETRLLLGGDLRRRRARRAEKRQLAAAARIGQLITAFEDIVLEADNNRLQEADGRLQTRLNARIIKPLRDDVHGLMKAAAVALRRGARSNGGAADHWQQAAADQRRVVAQMTEIRKHLVASDDVNRALKLLREIIQQQRVLQQKTIKESEERIEGLFDD